MKKIIALILALSCVSGISAYAKTVQITIDSNDAYISDDYILGKTLDAAAFIQNDITMVPLSFITDAFGVEVQWEHFTKQVTIKHPDKTIELRIGDMNATVISNGESSVYELMAPPVIVNDRTMVPLRFISETLGNNVDYVAPTRQVLITDEEPAVMVGDVPLYKNTFRTYALINSFYQSVYEPNQFNQLVYENLVYLAAIKDQWSKVDPADTISAQDLETVLATGDAQWAIQGILSANLVQLLQISGAHAVAYNSFVKSVTDEMVKEAYSASYVCAKHILLSTEGLSPAEKNKVKSTAETVLKKAKGGEDFDALIKLYGEDPGMTSNPDGYVFTYGDMVEEFEKASFALKENEISGLVETDYGYHIIMKMPLPPLTDDMKAQIRGAVANEVIKAMVPYAPVVNNITMDELFEYLNQTSVG